MTTSGAVGSHALLRAHGGARHHLPVPARLERGGVRQPPGGDGPDPSDTGSATTRRLFDFGAGLPRFFLNSLIVSVLTVAITLTVSLFGGYAFARFDFPGRELLFLVTLAILMVPYATLLIPLYVLLNMLGLQNSLVGLALVLSMYQLPFAMFMMRISFEAVPRELEDAALVDGCGSFAALRRILLPAVVPGLITVGLFAFLAAWNDFFAPLILISDPSQAPLPLAIATLASADDGGHRLRSHGGRRRRHGAALRRAVPGAAALLRARLHVRRRQGLMSRPGSRNRHACRMSWSSSSGEERHRDLR